MSTMTCVNLTVRRADRGVLNSADLEQFADFYEKEILGCYSGKQYPHVATDWKSMYAYCELCGYFESDTLALFAEAHPEYQIELISECNECDNRERVLYQGNLMECIQEERYFPEPQVIPWKYGE